MVTLFNQYGQPAWPTGARQPDKGAWQRVPDITANNQRFEVWLWKAGLVRVLSTITRTEEGEWVFCLMISIQHKRKWMAPPNDLADVVLKAFGLGGAREYHMGVETARRTYYRPVYNKGPNDG